MGNTSVQNPFINLLIYVVEICGVEPEIWIQVDGVRVSGTAIGVGAYCEGFHGLLTGEILKRLQSERSDLQSAIEDAPGFIYLKWVTFSDGREELVFWQIPVSKVSGIGFLKRKGTAKSVVRALRL